MGLYAREQNGALKRQTIATSPVHAPWRAQATWVDLPAPLRTPTVVAPATNPAIPQRRIAIQRNASVVKTLLARRFAPRHTSINSRRSEALSPLPLDRSAVRGDLLLADRNRNR